MCGWGDVCDIFADDFRSAPRHAPRKTYITSLCLGYLDPCSVLIVYISLAGSLPSMTGILVYRRGGTGGERVCIWAGYYYTVFRIRQGKYFLGLRCNRPPSLIITSPRFQRPCRTSTPSRVPNKTLNTTTGLRHEASRSTSPPEQTYRC